MSRTVIDTTALDTLGGYRTFIGGFRNAGEVTLNMNFARDTYEVMKEDFESDSSFSYEIQLPDSEDTVLSFNAIVTQLPLDISTDDKITANAVLKITGQVSVSTAAGETTTEVGVDFGTAQEFEEGIGQYFAGCKVASDKFLVAYKDTEDSNKGKCVIGTVTGTDISFGAPVVFETGNTSWVSSCYVSDNKVLIAFSDEDDNYRGKCILVTVADSTPSFSNTVLFEDGAASYISTCLVNTDRVLICFRDPPVADRGKCIVVNTGASDPAPDTGNVPDFSQDDILGCACCTIDTDKALVVFTDYSDNNSVHAVVISISGTVPTPDMVNDLAINGVDTSYMTVAKCDTNEAIVGYCTTAGSAGKAAHISVFGTTPSKGTELDLTDQATHIDGCQIGIDEVMFVSRGAAPYPGRCAIITNSGGTLTETSVNNFADAIGAYTSCCVFDTDAVAISYNGDSNGESTITRTA